MSIQITGGVTFTGGLKINNASSTFTINSEDISSPFEVYQGYSNYTTAGFTSDGELLYNGIGYSITQQLHDQIASAIDAAGFTGQFGTNGAFVWNVSWSTGGTGLVRLALDGNGGNTVVIAPIDETDTAWQSGSRNGPAQTGTFTFPAVFTPYIPLTKMGNRNSWC